MAAATTCSWTPHTQWSPVPLPPFPNNVPTHTLLVIDYDRIKAGNPEEIERLWTAATMLGVWYLKNHGIDEEAWGMFDMAAETMDLPLDEKMKYEQGDEGLAFGYKAIGAYTVDTAGTKDPVQFINVAKDDALLWPAQARCSYPSTMNATVIPFVEKSLWLPNGTLLKKHPQYEHSGGEAWCTFSPPHRFSQSLLNNHLSGLQVFLPGVETWQYVKPIPGHAICNLGDAMSILSGGILRSNLHRVETKARSTASLSYFFARPANSVVLCALTEDSIQITEAVRRTSDPSLFDMGVTAIEWEMRHRKNQRMNNRKVMGPRPGFACRGTEHTDPVKIEAY
ncbi:hypothetical protein DFH07DRAFT_866043 [Mycena maculata]|uniref:Clavaminate synthase-like protein n=1 Tax=Mycena maculata TaxID=230809 RepID=A0AAD7NSP6_9AGAR|nr:hypothetical protein DFH07DRAFT_866043 [Mycena maculata]